MKVLTTAFPKIKAKDLKVIDKALKNYGMIGMDGKKSDPTLGLEHYLKDHLVTIEEKEKDFFIGIYPKQGNWEFNAKVLKVSGKLVNPVVGTIEPQP